MKRRLTYIHAREDVFDPKELQLDNNTLHINGLRAAREDRFTFGLYELPQEVVNVTP